MLIETKTFKMVGIIKQCMTNVDNESIQNLGENLKRVYNNIVESDTDFNFAYSSDEDTLVIVSNSKGPDKEFRENISKSIIEELDQPCGFILSDGPDEYEDHTTAYIRMNPDNAYEYILAPITKLNFSDEDVTEIFHRVYSISNEEDEENPLLMAATYLYIFGRQKDHDNKSISYISELMNVSEKDIRNNVLKLSNIMS